MAGFIFIFFIIINILIGVNVIYRNKSEFRFFLFFTLKYSVLFTFLFGTMAFVGSLLSDKLDFEFIKIGYIFLGALTIFGFWALAMIGEDH